MTARVEHSVKHGALGAQLHPQDGHLALPIGRFWHPAIGFAPQDIGMAVVPNLAMQKTGLAQGRMCRAQRRQPRDKARQRRITRPCHPSRFIVLRIGIVVALLAVAQLIARQQHRRAL